MAALQELSMQELAFWHNLLSFKLKDLVCEHDALFWMLGVTSLTLNAEPIAQSVETSECDLVVRLTEWVYWWGMPRQNTGVQNEYILGNKISQKTAQQND